MAETVKRILMNDQDSRSRSESGPLTSLRRKMESWSSIWREYDDTIGEVGHEDGEYAVQEHHWEDPILKAGALPVTWSLPAKK